MEEDNDRRRRAALEAGREMLEKYKANRSNKRLSGSLEPASDEDSIHNETENRSMDLRSNNESISMSEGEGDGELERLAGRVNELEELLQCKEVEVEVMNAEIDHLRADACSPTSSHSQNSNIPYKDAVSKLQECLQAINQRDLLIGDLTTSLQQALAARDTLHSQVQTLNTQINNYNEKILALETTLNNQSNLASQLEQAQKEIKKLELEKETQFTELNNYKSQVEYFNEKIKNNSGEIDGSFEVHLKQKQCEDQVEKIKQDMKVILDKFANETKANNIKHENEIKELTAKYEAELQLLKEENKNLEARFAKETSDLQTRLSNSRRTIDTLKSDLVTGKESYDKEKELLAEQINLHKLQLDDVTSKYLSTASILDSKESIERSLEQALNDAASLRTENETLKFKLDDLTSRYSAAQNLIENGQMHERSLSNRIFSLEKSLSRLSGISVGELDATTYQTLDEVAVQIRVTQQKLEEKSLMEQELQQKIKNLEETVSKTQKELDSANRAKDNYEKQIKDAKNNHDRLKEEINSKQQLIEQLRQQLQSRVSFDSLDGMRMASVEFEREISELKNTVEMRDKETAEYIRKLEEINEANQRLQEESEKLKKGLATAYAQCATFEEKLDQTLGFGESKLEESSTLLDQTMSSTSSLDLEELLHKQTNYNKVLQKLDTCRKQLEDHEREKASLLRDIEKQNEQLDKAAKAEEQLQEEIRVLKAEIQSESQKLRTELEEKHAKEMEELRTYFEQKCLQMEKQYSEEIFSQQSKKMSDNDSEVEDLTEDLFVSGEPVDHLGGGGDASDALNKEAKLDQKPDEKTAKIMSEYEEKLKNLRKQLQEEKEKSGRTALLKAVNQFCQTEQIDNSSYSSSNNNVDDSKSNAIQESCNELNELRADYNRQLEEQVGLARVDIVNELREQIEALLTAESESDENWPSELLELRDKFTNNAKREMQTLKERHVEEIKRLKDGSNQAINDLQEEIRRIKSQTHESLHSNLIKERDTLHKACATLKNLVAQLIDYFADCEEEINNTLINEVLRKQFMPRLDGNLSFDGNASGKTKRVRFAPQSSEITTIVSKDIKDLLHNEKDIVKNLKGDLDTCLQRLKSECSKILNSSMSDSESWSTGIDSPSEKLVEAEKLVASVQEENEHLKVKVIDLQQRLLIAENKKEVISEGYGEQNESVVIEEQEQDFSQLQDRAKYVVMNGSNDTGYLLQLIDELCRNADKSMDEMRKEKEDLQHQIEAADKQLRSTRKFQEEQAIEREAERDEATRQIQQLQEKLREREREKDRDYRINSVEVEGLTVQLREAETKKTEAETELKTAVEKIWELREVIRDLEQQVQSRSEREEILDGQIEQLEEIIVAQTKNQQELVQELELVKAGSENNQLSDHIGHLQEELRKAQLSSEQLTANSSALRQLRIEIRELQTQLNRKTRELENMHVCGSSLSISQPSEDVSIRDQIEASRCPTPDDPTSPPVLPLDNVLKLKESLLKHFRVEDVALKRLKDLDIQLTNLQKQNEVLLEEQEMLQQMTSEQLFEISKLRTSLEQQKQNAPFAQRQATARLESQMCELNERLENAGRALRDKDVELNEVKDQLERVSRILAEKEKEMVDVFDSEKDVMQNLRDRISILEQDNDILRAKLSVQGNSQNNLPQIIDTIVGQKDAEIRHLQDQLAKREKELEIYTGLDETQLRNILDNHQQHVELPKTSARTLSDILSINSECEDGSSDPIREAPNYTRTQNASNFRLPNATLINSKRDVVDYSQPIMETPKVPRLDLGPHSPNSEAINSHIEVSKEMTGICPTPETDETEAHESTTTSEDQSDVVCPRHGKYGPNNGNVAQSIQLPQGTPAAAVQRIQELESHLHEIKQELEAKTRALEQRESELMEIQNNLQQLQENIESLNHERLLYETEYKKAKDNEAKIQKDMMEVENELKMTTEELEDYKEKVRISEKIFYEETMLRKRSEAALQEKLQEINNLKEIVAGKDITIETLQARAAEIDSENRELYECRRKFDTYQQEIHRLSEGLNSRDQMIRRLEEMARRSSLSGGSSPSEKDQEIYHLQEYLKEKDKVIRQMSDDSKSLHRALETIQNKMKESGNVVELRRKLKEERKNNAELSELIAKLKTELEMMNNPSRRVNEEDNDITEMVQQQLNLSARLDQQLLNVIESEPEDVLRCNNLKQANKEIGELTRLKDDLEIEREMLKSQISEYESRIMQLNADVEQKSKAVSKLEESLAKERHAVRSLQLQLQREKNTAEEDKSRDTELISQLRIKLEDALEMRNKLLLEQRNFEIMNALKSPNSSGLRGGEQEQEQLKLAEELEAEKRKYEESQDTLKKVEADKARLEKQCKQLEEERKKLADSLDAVSLENEQLKADLLKVKADLKTKTEECGWQKSILKTVSDAENKRKQQRSSEHSELKTLRRELKNSHDLIVDFEADMNSLKKQLNESSEREQQLSRAIESLTDKETELTEQLTAAKTEEKRLRDIVADQDKELKMYLRREVEFAEQLERERSNSDKSGSPSQVFQRIKNLNSTIERLSQDKVHLYEKIEQLREENERYLDQIRFLETQLSQKVKGHQPVAIRDDAEERLQHFYGKFLRSESRRKALIYQKRYLLCIIAAYQYAEENTLAFLAQLTQTQRKITRQGPHRRNPRVRFRSAVFLVIGIQRMKWLILRWRTGKRVGANVVLGNVERHAPVQPSPRASRTVGASGHSPPVRERALNGTSNFSHDPYLRRFTDLQHSLNL